MVKHGPTIAEKQRTILDEDSFEGQGSGYACEDLPPVQSYPSDDNKQNVRRDQGRPSKYGDWSRDQRSRRQKTLSGANTYTWRAKFSKNIDIELE